MNYIVYIGVERFSSNFMAADQFFEKIKTKLSDQNGYFKASDNILYVPNYGSNEIRIDHIRNH